MFACQVTVCKNETIGSDIIVQFVYMHGSLWGAMLWSTSAVQASEQSVVWSWKECVLMCRFPDCGCCCACPSWSWPCYV